MVEIKKILACVDMSQYSLTALDYAVALAKTTEAEILVYNVISQEKVDSIKAASTLHYPMPGFGKKQIDIDKYISKLKEERTEKIKKMIKDRFTNEPSNIHIMIEKGLPVESILNISKKENADLIVMGSKGRGDLSMTFFGSVAEKVFRHSTIPVLSIRENHNRK